MEETSQPLSDAAPASKDEAPQKPARRPRKTEAANTTDRKTTAERQSRSRKAKTPPAAKAATADPGEIASSAPIPLTADEAQTSLPVVRGKAKSPALRSKSRTPAVKAASGQLAVKEDQPPALAQPVASSSGETLFHDVAEKTPSPQPRKQPAENRSEEAQSAEDQSDAPLAAPADSEHPETAPSKRRRRRGGRGRKRSSNAPATPTEAIPMSAAATENQAAPVHANAPEAVEEPEESVLPGTGEPNSRSRGRSRSRSRTKRQPQPDQASPEAGHTGAAGSVSEHEYSEPASSVTQNRQQRDTGPEVETLPLAAETPAALISASASLLAPVPVVNTLEARNGRSRKRGGRGRAARQPGQEQAIPAAAPTQAGTQSKPDPKGRKLLVSVLPDDQVEVVVVESGKVREYYIEMAHQVKIRGNIYKGVISNIDTNLQAAFVNYGAAKNGFLQIDEIHPEYYINPVSTAKGHKYPPIQKAMKAGQEVLVQVGKEPTGNKGAFLTTWISLAGRFLVLTPGQSQIGISRKVEDGEERNRLRELIKGLNPGEGLGAIVRTVSAGVTKTTMQKDLSYLKRLWKEIRKKGMQEKAPALIYAEPGLASRSMRDYLTDDVVEIWVDDEATAVSMRDMIALLFPRKEDLVKLHADSRRTLFERFDVLDQIEQIHSREVTLPSGGRLVFDQTEALMAIDINSGKTGGNSGKTSFESMAFRTNMEAAEMIPQQLRLRDIGGQVVIDFIEMRDQNQIRDVEKTLRNAMKSDRARHDVGKMSSFGLLQIVRQRTGSSAISISMESCPFCQGTGTRRNMEWQAVQVLRDLHRKMRDAHDSGQTGLIYTVDTELAWYLLNHKRERLTSLENDLNVKLEIRPARSV